MSRHNVIGTEFGGPSFEYGRSGGIVEHEMLGDVRRECEKLGPKDEYQPYDQVLQYTREHQRGDTSDPEAWFANDLHATIAKELELEDYSRLRFYTAVGSKLDTFHSIDGFFELQVDPENPDDVVRVTFDLTTNPNKTDYRADVIIMVPWDGIDPKEDKEIYQNILRDSTSQFVARLKSYVKVA